MTEINRILQELDPDIIALQEMTPEILRTYFLCQPWLRKRYFISDERGSTFGNYYGVVIFSKIPFAGLFVHKLQTRMGRKAILAKYEGKDGSSLVVATSHLESESSDVPIRKKQIEQIFEDHLKNEPQCIFMGDTNLAYEGEEKCFPKDTIDVWSVCVIHINLPLQYESKQYLKPNLPGFTMGNRRLDRALIKSWSWQAVDVTIIGTQKVPIDQEEANKLQKEENDHKALEEANNPLLAALRKQKKIGDHNDDDDDLGPLNNNNRTCDRINPSDHYGLYIVLQFVSESKQ